MNYIVLPLCLETSNHFLLLMGKIQIYHSQQAPADPALPPLQPLQHPTSPCSQRVFSLSLQHVILVPNSGSALGSPEAERRVMRKRVTGEMFPQKASREVMDQEGTRPGEQVQSSEVPQSVAVTQHRWEARGTV